MGVVSIVELMQLNNRLEEELKQLKTKRSDTHKQLVKALKSISVKQGSEEWWICIDGSQSCMLRVSVKGPIIKGAILEWRSRRRDILQALGEEVE